MPFEQFVLLFLFVTALVGTPGPANLSLLALGMRHGAIRTLPFLFGTLTGFQIILSLNALGLMALISTVPWLLDGLKVVCLGYICYLAYGIAVSRPVAIGEAQTPAQRAGDFVRGFWIHPLNPKAYAMQIAALTQFVRPGDGMMQFVVIAVTFIAWGGVLNFGWAAGGALFRDIANTPSRYRIASLVMAVLMVASVTVSLFLVSD